MSERIVMWYSLRDDVSEEDYVEWLREEHYPWGRSVPSQSTVEGYTVLDDYDENVEDPEMDQVAIIDIDDREQWYEDMEGYEHEELGSSDYHWEKWHSFVDDYKILFTEQTDA